MKPLSFMSGKIGMLLHLLCAAHGESEGVRRLQMATLRDIAPTYADTYVRTGVRVGGANLNLRRVPGWRYGYVPGRGYISYLGQFVPMQNLPYQMYPQQPGTNNYAIWAYGQPAFTYRAAPIIRDDVGGVENVVRRLTETTEQIIEANVHCEEHPCHIGEIDFGSVGWNDTVSPLMVCWNGIPDDELGNLGIVDIRMGLSHGDKTAPLFPDAIISGEDYNSACAWFSVCGSLAVLNQHDISQSDLSAVTAKANFRIPNPHQDKPFSGKVLFSLTGGASNKQTLSKGGSVETSFPNSQVAAVYIDVDIRQDDEPVIMDWNTEEDSAGNVMLTLNPIHFHRHIATDLNIPAGAQMEYGKNSEMAMIRGPMMGPSMHAGQMRGTMGSRPLRSAPMEKPDSINWIVSPLQMVEGKLPMCTFPFAERRHTHFVAETFPDMTSLPYDPFHFGANIDWTVRIQFSDVEDQKNDD